MTQKELLLKDLCARLPFSVKLLVLSWDEREMEYIDKVDILYSVNSDGYIQTLSEDYNFNIEEVKPYLFPLSSMTDEQKDEYHNTCNVGLNRWGDEVYYDCDESIDWLNAHHFDHRELIEKSLALDATGLNIY